MVIWLWLLLVAYISIAGLVLWQQIASLTPKPALEAPLLDVSTLEGMSASGAPDYLLTGEYWPVFYWPVFWPIGSATTSMYEHGHLLNGGLLFAGHAVDG